MRLTGHRCQCAACGKFFSRSSVFDKHRTGEYGGGRRCMTAAEMEEKGMRLTEAGVWVGENAEVRSRRVRERKEREQQAAQATAAMP